ncbi:MAG: hypothetical protein OEL81_01505 [Nitrosopumilus sp.]|nr:hypothetical protein [Nitrosopumilus sp.]
MKKEFRSFNDARKFVRKLNLKTQHEWKEHYRSGKLPDDIPNSPHHTYKEWKGYGDWLGTGRIANQKKIYLEFTKAKQFVHSLNFKNKYQWDAFCKSNKKPDNIPADPRRYKSEFKSWGDWLGHDYVSTKFRKYRSFTTARMYVHKQKIPSQTFWHKYVKSGKKPVDIPSAPNSSYKKEWKGWGDWLGTGQKSSRELSNTWLTWKEAKTLYQKIAKENNITTTNQWNEYVKKHKLPNGLPPYPTDIYTKERIQSKLRKK